MFHVKHFSRKTDGMFHVKHLFYQKQEKKRLKSSGFV